MESCEVGFQSFGDRIERLEGGLDPAFDRLNREEAFFGESGEVFLDRFEVREDLVGKFWSGPLGELAEGALGLGGGLADEFVESFSDEFGELIGQDGRGIAFAFKFLQPFKNGLGALEGISNVEADLVGFESGEEAEGFVVEGVGKDKEGGPGNHSEDAGEEGGRTKVLEILKKDRRSDSGDEDIPDDERCFRHRGDTA